MLLSMISLYNTQCSKIYITDSYIYVSPYTDNYHEWKFLGEQFSHFEFLKECLKIIPDNLDVLTKYGRMDQKTARENCEKLLLLL